MWLCDCGVPNPDTGRSCIRCRLDRAARKQFVGPAVDVAAHVPIARALSRPGSPAETPSPRRPSLLRRLLPGRETPSSRPDPAEPVLDSPAPTDPAAAPEPDGLPDILPSSPSETPPGPQPLPQSPAPVNAAPPVAEGADPQPTPHPYDEIARELRRAILGG